MNTFKRYRQFLNLCIIFISLILIGCGYKLRYKLSEKDILMPEVKYKFKVDVTTLSDLRPLEERNKAERKSLHYLDCGDFTYDKQFKGKVNEEISKMVAKHLEFSEVFSEVGYVPIAFEQLTEEYLDSLRHLGIDGVLVGEILNFFGYYDTDASAYLLPIALGIPPIFLINPIKEKKTYFMGEEFTTVETDMSLLLLQEFLVIAGSLLGNQLESLRNRDIEWHTQLSLQLIDIETYEILWEDELESYKKEHKSIPGTNAETGKFKVAVKSLREVVNQMVGEISELYLSEEY